MRIIADQTVKRFPYDGRVPHCLNLPLMFLEHGAAEVWVVYPATRTMMVFRSESTLHIAADADYVCELVGVTVTPADRTVADNS